MQSTIKQNLRNEATWRRILYMLLFAIAFSLAKTLFLGIVVVQLGFLLLSGAIHPALRDFSRQLARYLYELLRYLGFETERRPFPFSPWNEYADRS